MRRFFTALLLLTLFSFLTYAQKPKTKPKTSKKTVAAQPTPTPVNEKEALDKALSQTDLTEKVSALQKFNNDFPASAEKIRVLEILVSARAQLADEKLRAGDTQAGIDLFKRAVAEAPNPISDKLFAEVVLQFPNNLFYRGQQAAAIEIARAIEEKINGSAKQLLALSTFYLGTENSAAARQLVDKAIAIEPDSASAYQTLGMTNRLAFQLEESATAYAKALELDPNSAIAKRSLAEMKRAVGKPDEAISLYRELLEKNPEDASAQTGLTLALFNAEKVTEAEAELAKALEKNPNNLPLLVGAAYWYAARREGEKAVDYGRKAVAVEPRYTWGHIALARGFMVQGNPLEAERELLAARQYGNFPTIDYEIAAARLAAGLYEEAARELRKNFAVKDDAIETRLGNRVPKQSKNFTELVELERRASIFEPLAADNPENAERLKSLLTLNQTLTSAEAKEEEIAPAVADFVKGDDKAKVHRQLYVANKLLQAKKNLPKVLELTQAAVASGIDSALDLPAPAAAVMADELYESRNVAISRNEVVVVPEIPRQTLSAILRGRIEEIAGWALYQQEKPQEAAVRLKRAVGILPEKSAWWRSSTWKLGAALDAAGRQPEALDAYIKHYANSQPDPVKRSVIEALYQKVNGSLDGLDDKIGIKPAATIAVSAPANETIVPVAENSNAQTAPSSVETTALENSTPPETSASTPKVEIKAENTAEPKTETSSPAPENIPQGESKIKLKAEAKPAESVAPKTEDAPKSAIEIVPEVKPIAEVKTDEAPATTQSNSETKSETAETKASEISKKSNSEPDAKTTPKPLFDPVIITVPKPEAAKVAKEVSAEEKPAEEKTSETAKTDEPKTEIPSSETPAVLKSTTPIDGSGEVRPRLFPPNPKAETFKGESDKESCRLAVSQESVTIISQGGNLGVLLGFEGVEGDVTKITATSSSPDDVDVSLDADVGKQSNRAFFIVKSISSNKGAYTVTFDSPCGKKEVLVKVR